MLDIAMGIVLGYFGIALVPVVVAVVVVIIMGLAFLLLSGYERITNFFRSLWR